MKHFLTFTILLFLASSLFGQNKKLPNVKLKTIDGKTVTETQKIEGTIAEIEKKANLAGEIVSMDVKKNTETTEKNSMTIQDLL